MLKSYNPSNGAYIGSVPTTSKEELKKVIEEAKIAQKKWQKIDIHTRIEILQNAAIKLGEISEEISQTLSEEMGKSLKRSREEVAECVNGTEVTTRNVEEALRAVVTKTGDLETRIEYFPLGVCGIITPWNFPVSMGHLMIIPALMAGNAVILKPSSETPLVAQAYVDCFNQVLPKNLLQVVHGSLGDELVNSKVDFIGFTGSIEVGKRIMENGSKTMKRFILELGGKDPLIVMEDADLDKAVKHGVKNSLDNSGQICTATERIFVDEKVADAFEAKVVEQAKRYKVGSYLDKEAWVGPIIHERQRKKILDQIDDAIAKGAKRIYGDENHPPYFVNPTVLTNVHEDMKIAKEETFGPVICITRYDDIEKAIQWANATEFGLGASIFGYKNVEAVARRIDAGMIGINTSEEGPGDFPFVGIKESGFGFHGSIEGHRQFAQTRVIRIKKAH